MQVTGLKLAMGQGWTFGVTHGLIQPLGGEGVGAATPSLTGFKGGSAKARVSWAGVVMGVSE